MICNNVDSGAINPDNPVTGQFVGIVRDSSREVIHIDQLWGIAFGDGAGSNGNTNQLYFPAGPDNDFAGLFGVIKRSKSYPFVNVPHAQGRPRPQAAHARFTEKPRDERLPISAPFRIGRARARLRANGESMRPAGLGDKPPSRASRRC